MFPEVKIWSDIITHLVLIWTTGSHHTWSLFHRLNFIDGQIDGQIDGFCSRWSPLNCAKVLYFHSHIHKNPFAARQKNRVQALQSSQNWRHSLCWLSRISHHSHKQIMFRGTTVFYWKPWVYKIEHEIILSFFQIKKMLSRKWLAFTEWLHISDIAKKMTIWKW